MQARKYTKLDFNDLLRLRVVMKRAVHFITCNGKYLGEKTQKFIKLRLSGGEECEKPRQLSIFELNQVALSALTGEL